MKAKNLITRHFVFAVFLFALSVFENFCFAEEASVTTIKIINARQTSYKKAEDTGNDTIILEGSVELSVTKDTTSSEIKADRITYDRKTEMLYAEGNVEIVTKSNGSGNDTTTASSLLLNTSTLEGIFDGGRVVQTQSDALNLPSGSTLVVFSDLFGKSDTNVIAFKNSSLTFCDDKNPHWKINATRTWLLPGGEFAFFNALLFVGVVPVMYFPAFYYPKDELIYNPVFSYRKREGYSIQNTLYLYGRKPLDSSSSSKSTSSTTSTTETNSSTESLKALYNFMKPSSLKKQKLEGIVLHNLDENYDGNTTNYFKFMADSYSTLGFMLGGDAHFVPSTKYVTKIDFKTMLGWSHTIFKDSTSGDYLVYSPNTGIIYDDKSNFLGVDMPFRYGFNFGFELSKPFRFSLSLPVYSDPFFAYDFEDRQETMDWISYFLSTQDKSEEEITITEVSSLTWNLTSSYSPTIPTVLTPYLSSFSINLTSSVNIASTATSTFADGVESEWKTATPQRKFYYPSQVTPVSINSSISGTIFQYPFKAKTSKTVKDVPKHFTKPDELKSDAQLEKELQEKLEQEQKEAEKEEEKKEEIEEETEEEYKFVEPQFPELEFTESTKTLANGIAYTLGYSIAPSFVNQLSYSSVPLKTSEDFDWENIRSSIITFKMPSTLNSNLTYGGNFFGLKNSLSYEPVIQKHPYIQVVDNSDVATTGGYTEASKNTIVLSDYNAQVKTLTNTNTVSLYPFANTTMLSDTGVYWNTTLKLYRQKFIGDVDNPKYEDLKLDWDDSESVTVNSLNCVIGLNELDKKFKQTLTLTSVMPPQLKQYTASLNLVFPYVTNTVSMGIQQKSKEDKTWKKNPLQQSLTVSIPIFATTPKFVENVSEIWQKPLNAFFGYMNSTIKFTESLNYVLQEEDDVKKHFDSFKLSLSWKSISLSYVGSYTYGYDLQANEGWKVRSEKEFLPYSFSFSYSPASKTYYKWSNRIQFAPSLSTSIVADLIRPTNSYLSFAPSVTFKINQFFNLTFSSTSKNSILYWYFHDGLYDEWGGFPGNMFKDLLDSFRFDDDNSRRGSGFKLKSLNMTISHELHDWSFKMTCKIEPRLITENNKTQYDFSPYLTIGIVWNPMESMKTEIIDEYGKWSLK